MGTSPHSLHGILVKVCESGAPTFREGWSVALDAEWDSGEFARRHAEVSSLLSETIEQIQALPERSRVRFSRYYSQWWSAIVQPNAGWVDPARPARALINQEMLDHLESAADLVAEVLFGTSSAPRGDNLEALSESCNSWLAILAETPDSELPAELKGQIVHQIHHLVWLISNVELFGVARVSRETSSVIGSLAQASTALAGGDAETGGKWKRALLGFVAASVVFTTGATQLQTAIEAGSGAVKGITQVVDAVTNSVE